MWQTMRQIMWHTLHSRLFTGVLLVAAAGATMTAATAAHAQARLDTSVTIDGSATVEVVAWSSDIVVNTVSERRLRVRNTGEARVDVTGGGRSVRVDASLARSRNNNGTLTVDVPRGTTVLVRSQSGEIAVRGTGANVEVRTTSGDITIADAARVRIEAVAGDIAVSRISDGVRVNSTSGDIRLANVTGDIEISGTSSTVVMDDVSSRRVQVKVVSGDVRWRGRFADEGRYEFNAHSGDIRLIVPRSSHALLDVRTFNGDITTTDLPLTLIPDPTAAERNRNTERDRDRLRTVRDSVERTLADSMRRARAPQTQRDSASFERNLERSIERLVESVMRSVTGQLESLSVRFDGMSNSGRAQRFQLGSSGGPLVTVSTFSGDIIVGSTDTARPR